MKFTIITFFTLTFLSFHVNGQDLDCQKFKDGEFVIKKDSLDIEETVITRKGKTQTEQNQSDPTILKFKVNWINTCSYTLTPTKQTLKHFQSQGYPDIGILTVEIIETKASSYIQKSTASLIKDLEYISEMHIKQ